MMEDSGQAPAQEEDGFPVAIASLLASSRNAKLSQVRMWDLSLMYLNGQQNIRYDRSLQQYVSLRTTPGRNQLVVNLILNMYRSVVSRLQTNYPGVTVMPSSPSNEDIAKAKASEEALKYFYHSQNVKRDLGKAMQWMVSCGNVGLHQYFDNDEDKIKLKVISPYDMFFEAGCSDENESAFVAIRSIVRKKDLIAAFPDKKSIIEDQIDLGTDQSEDNTYPHSQSYQGESFFFPRIELYEIYFKEGTHALVVGNHYLYKAKTPIKLTPVQLIKYTNLPDRLWGKGMIESIIDIQNLYNKARNQIINNVALMSNPKWLIPKTAGVNGSAIKGTPGEKIYYNAAGGAPQQISAAGLPSYVMENIAKLQGEMLDVAGVHSTTLGKRAVGVTSGKAIAELASQDTSQLIMTQENVEHAVKQMATCVLSFMKRFYSEERFIKMFDGMGSMTFRAISTTDIVDVPEVFIEAGSLFRDEAQDRDRKVLELLELGLIEPATAMQEISFKTGNSMVLKEVASMNHTQEMLDAVKQGAQIEVFANDDLKTFKKTFGDFMKTEEYYQLDEPIRDYLRDIIIALTSWQPPPPGDPALNKSLYKVFPAAIKPGSENEELKQMMPSSDDAKEQMMQSTMEQAVASRAFQTAKGQTRQQPQGNDTDVIAGRGVE